MVSSYVGENKTFETQFLSGELEVELVLKERWPSVFVPAALASQPSLRQPVLELWLQTAKRPATSTAWTASWRWGWLQILPSSKLGKAMPTAIWSSVRPPRNFNPMMATAGKVTIAEVEEFVPTGELDPDEIHTPGIFVQRVIKASDYETH